MHFEAFGHTDRGKKRQINEDDYLCLDVSSKVAGVRQPFYLLAVADGIGGHAGGQVASSAAINIIMENVILYATENNHSISRRKLLEDLIQLANKKIYQQASQDSTLTGMGTTMVAALVLGHQVTVANIGDSRFYHMKNGGLQQISVDHSWRAEQLKENLLTYEQIANSPFKNMITRSLGYNSEVDVDIFQLDLSGEGYLFLCTDGLYGPLPEERMRKIFRHRSNPDRICRRLVHQANRLGGNDNITGVVARYRLPESTSSERLSPQDTVKLDQKF